MIWILVCPSQFFRTTGFTPASMHLVAKVCLKCRALHFRHTFASLLNSEGVDIARISAELGHSNITTTLNVYTHVFGGASASSRGIADVISSKINEGSKEKEYQKAATIMALDRIKEA